MGKKGGCRERLRKGGSILACSGNWEAAKALIQLLMVKAFLISINVLVQ